MSLLLTSATPYPGLAYHEILANLGGNESLLTKLAALFIEQHAADISLINAALQQQDWDLALHLTHALRGTAANLGAVALHDAAHCLETALCNRGSSPLAVPSEMELAMAELIPSLQRLIASHHN